MARGLYCPDCREFIGKSVECPMHNKCGNCGCKFYNEDGDREDGESKKKQPDEEWGKLQ